MIRILRVAVLGLLLAAAAAPGLTAQVPPPERRDRLEAQVRERFIDMAEGRLALTPAQRSRLATVIEEGAEARRALMGESMELRHSLMDAARDSTTPSSTFEDLLRRMDALAQREHELERREQERLADFLNPRQRALFLMMRMRFNEQVRDLRGRGPRR